MLFVNHRRPQLLFFSHYHFQQFCLANVSWDEELIFFSESHTGVYTIDCFHPEI